MCIALLRFAPFLGTRVWAAAGRTGQGLAAAADAADHSRKAPTSPRHDDARRGLAGYDHDTSGRRHAAAMSGGLAGCFDGFLRITFGCDDYRGGGGRLSCSKEAESLSYMVRVCVAALFLPGTFESPESVVAALFLPSSLRSLWSPHCSYLRVSMYHNGVASSRPPGASLRIARHSILVVVLPFRSQQEEPRDESFPCHSEVSVRYRTRSSRFFPACSVLTSSQGRSPRQINFEVSVRYLTRSSRFFPAVSGRARPLFGLGHCAGMFRSQGRSPANRFRGQCPLYPLPYPIVPVLSRCVGAGTPAVRSWSLCCRVPFSREEPPANQFRGQCPLPYRIVPVLSRCAMRCGSPSVRVATTLWCAFRATTASQLHHQLRP